MTLIRSTFNTVAPHATWTNAAIGAGGTVALAIGGAITADVTRRVHRHYPELVEAIGRGIGHGFEVTAAIGKNGVASLLSGGLGIYSTILLTGAGIAASTSTTLLARQATGRWNEDLAVRTVGTVTAAGLGSAAWVFGKNAAATAGRVYAVGWLGAAVGSGVLALHTAGEVWEQEALTDAADYVVKTGEKLLSTAGNAAVEILRSALEHPYIWAVAIGSTAARYYGIF